MVGLVVAREGKEEGKEAWVVTIGRRERKEGVCCSWKGREERMRCFDCTWRRKESNGWFG